MNGLGCKLLGADAESRDEGATRIERDGQSWFRVAATPKTVMTTLGPVTFRRARYRNGACSTSLAPVDESLGLVDDWREASCGPVSFHGGEGKRLKTLYPGRITHLYHCELRLAGVCPGFRRFWHVNG